MLIGVPTVQAVWGQKFAPALLDRYLASKGFEPQMADEPNDQHGRDILFAPLPGDPGAHGPYRHGNGGRIFQMRLRPHATAIAAAMGLVGLAAYGLTARRT